MPVTAEELHQAFRDVRVGLADDSTYVDRELCEREGGQYADIDGDVNFAARCITKPIGLNRTMICSICQRWR